MSAVQAPETERKNSTAVDNNEAADTEKKKRRDEEMESNVSPPPREDREVSIPEPVSRPKPESKPDPVEKVSSPAPPPKPPAPPKPVTQKQESFTESKPEPRPVQRTSRPRPTPRYDRPTQQIVPKRTPIAEGQAKPKVTKTTINYTPPPEKAPEFPEHEAIPYAPVNKSGRQTAPNQHLQHLGYWEKHRIYGDYSLSPFPHTKTIRAWHADGGSKSSPRELGKKAYYSGFLLYRKEMEAYNKGEIDYKPKVPGGYTETYADYAEDYHRNLQFKQDVAYENRIRQYVKDFSEYESAHNKEAARRSSVLAIGPNIFRREPDDTVKQQLTEHKKQVSAHLEEVAAINRDNHLQYRQGPLKYYSPDIMYARYGRPINEPAYTYQRITTGRARGHSRNPTTRIVQTAPNIERYHDIIRRYGGKFPVPQEYKLVTKSAPMETPGVTVRRNERGRLIPSYLHATGWTYQTAERLSPKGAPKQNFGTVSDWAKRYGIKDPNNYRHLRTIRYGGNNMTNIYEVQRAPLPSRGRTWLKQSHAPKRVGPSHNPLILRQLSKDEVSSRRQEYKRNYADFRTSSTPHVKTEFNVWSAPSKADIRAGIMEKRRKAGLGGFNRSNTPRQPSANIESSRQTTRKANILPKNPAPARSTGSSRPRGITTRLPRTRTMTSSATTKRLTSKRNSSIFGSQAPQTRRSTSAPKTPLNIFGTNKQTTKKSTSRTRMSNPFAVSGKSGGINVFGANKQTTRKSTKRSKGINMFGGSAKPLKI